MPCRAGTGSDALNSQTPAFYFGASIEWQCRSTNSSANDTTRDAASCQNEPGVDVALNQFDGVPFGDFPRSGANMVAMHLHRARGMVLSNPAAVLRPWLAMKSFAPREWDFLPDTGPTDFYQEEVFHAALIGADSFFYFNPWDGYVNGVRATGADHALLAGLLSELDLVVGCATRQWVQDRNVHRWSDSFELSGAVVGDSPNRTAVWRFSPRTLPAGTESPLDMVHKAHDGRAVISPVLLTNESAPCSLTFAGGAVTRVPTAHDGTVIAPAGVWISSTSVGGVALRCPGRLDRSWPLRHHAL